MCYDDGGAVLDAPIPLEELAAQQGVAPAHDMDAISDLWPADDDPDALLRFILEQRHGDSGEA